MTIHPAKLCGISKFCGSLEAGKMANFFILNGSSYFVDSPKIHSTWTNGTPEIFLDQENTEDTNKA